MPGHGLALAIAGVRNRLVTCNRSYVKLSKCRKLGDNSRLFSRGFAENQYYIANKIKAFSSLLVLFIFSGRVLDTR
jgi:hypothetical protein